MHKNYILDANILIHDPNSIFEFADNTVIIPVGVITEIDRFKKEMTDRGYNARAVVRLLDGLRNERSLAAGVSLPGGGELKVYCEPDRVFANGNGQADAEILRVAQAVQDADHQTPVIIVTKDINLRIRADAAGLKAEDYESDQVLLSDLYSGTVEWIISAAELDIFRNTGRLDLPLRGAGGAGSEAPSSTSPDGEGVRRDSRAGNGTGDELMEPNVFVLLRADDANRSTALARVDVDGKSLTALRQAEHGLWGIKPRNKEQYYAIDALLDERIQLVTLMGKAGTGKTLLGIAAGMHLTIAEKRFRGLLVCRPIFPLGRDLGYLPGDIGQKLDPWMKPVVDTVEHLMDMSGPIRGHGDIAGLMRSGLLEIQPLTYIRGRSISNRFVVIDEAQNLTPLEVKTVITRVGQNAKIVLTGDPYQIDNPYVDGNSNGFSYLVNRFRSQAIAAHVELRKGERSPLAELAANLL